MSRPTYILTTVTELAAGRMLGNNAQQVAFMSAQFPTQIAPVMGHVTLHITMPTALADPIVSALMCAVVANKYETLSN